MLKDKILADIKQAMKDKDNFKRDALRFLHSAIKQVEIDSRKDLDDSEIIKIIQKSIKQRNDSIEQYKQADRSELIEKEQNEVTLLETYLPTQLSDDELKKEVADIISSVGATDKKDIGKVMGAASKKLAGIADGARINKAAQELLG